MRFVLDLRYTADGVEGEIVTGDTTDPQRFSSWLDLIRLLEPRGPQQQPSGRRAEAMRTDVEQLMDINEGIGAAESNGDTDYLDSVVAPVLAFRRASGACVGREQFLGDDAPGAERMTRVVSVELLDHDRAVVRCVVELDDGDQHRAYDNFRLFVRIYGTWRLLGWANAELPPVISD